MEPFDPLIPPPPLVSASLVSCVGCGYDLSGTAIGSICPECGKPVQDSIRRDDPAARTSGYAIGSLVCGILSLAACGLIGIVAIILYFPAMKEVRGGNGRRLIKGLRRGGTHHGDHWLDAGHGLSCVHPSRRRILTQRP